MTEEDNRTICRTVTELIETLQKLPPDAVPSAHEPPFTGILVYSRGEGKVGIASLWNTDEGRDERAAKNASKAVA